MAGGKRGERPTSEPERGSPTPELAQLEVELGRGAGVVPASGLAEALCGPHQPAALLTRLDGVRRRVLPRGRREQLGGGGREQAAALSGRDRRLRR